MSETDYQQQIIGQHARTATLLEQAVDLLAKKNDRWLLIAVIIVAIAWLSYDNIATKKQLISFLHESNVREEQIIERNTTAFNNVNDSLRVAFRK